MSKHSSAGGGQKTEAQQIESKDAEKAELNSVPQVRLAWSPENEEDGAPLHHRKSCIGVGWFFWILLVVIVTAIIAVIVICTGTDACKSCKPVDGVWSEFEDWSECSANCDGGTQTRTKSCTAPNQCGTECSGDDEELRECNTEPCPTPCNKPAISDGKVEPDSDTINSGTTYEVTCNAGFVISDSGISTVTCTNGVLSTVPTCQPAPCNKPDINDGKVEPDSETINSGTTYEVTCNAGFVISDSGISTVTCTNGALSTVPTCQPAPCDKPDINDGKVEPDLETINSGTTYEVTCNAGFVISDSGISTVTCTNGVLSTVPTCQPAPCDKPAISDGKVEPDLETINSGTTYEVTCNDGFVISDSGISTVTCTNGVLSTVPTCQPVPCDKPDINDGKVEPDSETINSGATYKVTCNTGFVISDSGISTVTCTNGALSTVPTCQPVPCNKPSINDGKVEPDSETINSGATYEVTCNAGFVISDSGISTVTCTNGVLSTVPTCQPVPCDKPAISDGKVEPDSETINSGTTYEVTCNAGFVISDSGISTVTCTNGVLSTVPTCQPAPCNKPDINDGKVEPDLETINSGTTYEVTCNAGFVISDSGISTITCTNGALSTVPTCDSHLTVD
ncbi:complement factor H-like [Bolinopsis microptera]|uniref:complement factor H-like n=1 Tax=Bolinopsis microptera TaxID=2820187 RepID=UPI00307AE179